jgi:hypothetical protein
MKQFSELHVDWFVAMNNISTSNWWFIAANTKYQKSNKNKSIRDKKLVTDSPLSQLSIKRSDSNQHQKLHPVPGELQVFCH